MKIVYSGYLSSVAISQIGGGNELDIVLQIKDLKSAMHRPIQFTVSKKDFAYAVVGGSISLTIETTERA